MPPSAPPDNLRLFFAVLLAPELREPAGAVQDALARAGAKIKWVEPQNLHFTLKFLGDMRALTLPGLTSVADAVAATHAPFEVTLRGAGAFPRPADARAIWLGCATGGEGLTALATDLDRALVAAGLAAPEDRPFKPHLTIGRNKDRLKAAELAAAITAQRDAPVGMMRVESFVLMRSELGPRGPTYTELARAHLQASPAPSP